jgi:uncharacterized protein (TIGR00730 family)
VTSSYAVCVFCASSDDIDPRYLDLASAVGEALARCGWTLVSGGGSVGCMGAVARAARAAGGHTVGVIPEALRAAEVADDDADELLVTPDMRSRKGEMDRRSDAFLALPGGLGTLEELFEVWVARVLAMHDKPVVVCDPYDDYAPLRQQVDVLVTAGFARASARDAVTWTTDVASAVDALSRHRVVPTPGLDEVLESEP